jgi:hypothetical protein
LTDRARQFEAELAALDRAGGYVRRAPAHHAVVPTHNEAQNYCERARQAPKAEPMRACPQCGKPARVRCRSCGRKYANGRDRK